jgi:phage terminase small subunit
MMTPRQQAFVEQFLILNNATRAATLAGYSARTARAKGCDLLKKPEIAAAVAAGRKAQARRARIDADRVLRELAAIALSDIRRIAEWRGTDIALRPSAALAADDRAAIAAIAASRGKVRVRMHSKLQALDRLLRHLGFDKPRAAAGTDPLPERRRAEQVRAVLLARLARLAQKPDES